MAEKYHLSPSSGRPNKCNATKRGCPVGKSDEDHFDSKDEARAAYETRNSDKTVAAPLKKKPVLTHPNGRAIKPVLSSSELDDELDELEREDLHGSSLGGVLTHRRVTLRTIEEQEAQGDYIVDFKVPSYYETSCSTDLARRALGLPARARSAADETPLRKMQLELIQARKDTFGLFSDNESYKKNQDHARNLEKRYAVMVHKERIAKVKDKVDLTPLQGNSYSVPLYSKAGLALGSIERPFSPGEQFTVFPRRANTWGRSPLTPVGKFDTEEEALAVLIHNNLHSLEREL